MKLYVGNLPYSVNEDDLRDMFAPYGAPESVIVIMDRDTGRSKGFGFVEFSNDTEARAAMQALNGREINGRALTVNEARPRAEGGLVAAAAAVIVAAATAAEGATATKNRRAREGREDFGPPALFVSTRIERAQRVCAGLKRAGARWGARDSPRLVPASGSAARSLWASWPPPPAPQQSLVAVPRERAAHGIPNGRQPQAELVDRKRRIDR